MACIDNLSTEGSGELDSQASLLLPEKKCTCGDLKIEHLFQAESLKAELRLVPLEILGCPALVFNGIGSPFSLRLWQTDANLIRCDAMELHDIGNAGDTQLVGAETDGTDDADGTSRFLHAAICLLVQNCSFGSKAVVLPLLFDMKENKSPGAMNVLPHGGERKELFFRIQRVTLLPED